MAIIIEQRPLYNILPIGQQVIFAVSDNAILANKFKVKFVAQIFVSGTAINLSNNNDLIGTFKTTPNNAGVGIFDLRPVLETFVKPDNVGSTWGNGSRYKTSSVTHPLHLIDKIAVSENAIKFFAINFYVEYSDSETGDIIDFEDEDPTPTEEYIMFNGVLQYDDVLTLNSGYYGYDLQANGFYPNFGTNTFLTNAPRTQNARLTDYGTFPFLNQVPLGSDDITSFILTFYDSAGGSLGSSTIVQDYSTGGTLGQLNYSSSRLMYAGAFPANLRNYNTTFQALVTAGTLAYYDITAVSSGGTSSASYRINIICPNERGYEGIRLTWLNQWGVWDYYTFNMKSTKSISTKRTSYTQLGGTWNEKTFSISGYKGGKKNFRVNSTEKIKMNTDFVSEAEGVWFEELINSNEVYIVNEYDGTEVVPYDTITNKYIEPVTLTTSSYVKKTIANDKLMQYTFEIEKSKMQRTQAV